jgi:hypothetical protein
MCLATDLSQQIGRAFDGVSGRFFPAVWLLADGVTVSVNFGHEPFVFDFAKTLPFDFASQPLAQSTPRLPLGASGGYVHIFQAIR